MKLKNREEKKPHIILSLESTAVNTLVYLFPIVSVIFLFCLHNTVIPLHCFIKRARWGIKTTPKDIKPKHTLKCLLANDSQPGAGTESKKSVSISTNTRVLKYWVFKGKDIVMGLGQGKVLWGKNKSNSFSQTTKPPAFHHAILIHLIKQN